MNKKLRILLITVLCLILIASLIIFVSNRNNQCNNNSSECAKIEKENIIDITFD